MLSFANCPEDPPRSVRIDDIRLETIYVVSPEYNWRKKSFVTPYFRLKGVLQPPGSSLGLEYVYPREWWDNKAGILRTPSARSLNSRWVSGVLSFRDKETGLELDVILGGVPGETGVDQSEKYSSAFPKPWCLVSRVNHSASNLSSSSDTRLKKVFEDANHFPKNQVLTTSWIEPLVAKVTFETTEFLGRRGFGVQVEIS